MAKDRPALDRVKPNLKPVGEPQVTAWGSTPVAAPATPAAPPAQDPPQQVAAPQPAQQAAQPDPVPAPVVAAAPQPGTLNTLKKVQFGGLISASTVARVRALNGSANAQMSRNELIEALLLIALQKVEDALPHEQRSHLQRSWDTRRVATAAEVAHLTEKEQRRIVA